jgi:homoserine dehydrogenase
MHSTTPLRPEYTLALLGFGNVGQAFLELLLEKQADLSLDPGLSFKIVGIASGSHGRAINPEGFPLQELLEAYRNGKSLDDYSSIPIDNSQDFIEKCKADALVESIPVDYQTGEPALGYLRTALNLGLHAVTANKGPVVHGYHELTKLARQNSLAFYFESAVMDGAPVFSVARHGLPGAVVEGFSGILNSTTNLILSRMEQGETQEEAIAYAQSIGIAESDPSGDVDGWDAAVKVAALATVLMDIPLLPDQIDRTGIRGLTPDLIQDAAEAGKRWKLVCDVARDENSPRGIAASIKPQMVDQGSTLYHISGKSAILEITSDVLGKLTLIEDDPSPSTTAYGLLADLLNAVDGDWQNNEA